MYLQVSHISKSYGIGEARGKVLDDISTEIETGEMCVISGPSGSGKSTFLNIIGGLETVDSGTALVGDMNITKLKSKQLARYRRDTIGFVFQFYNLIPNLTVSENIAVCQYLSEAPLDATEILDILGMEECKDKFPFQLSGGQQQRCAIARALAKNPSLLLCDEPTGAVDSKNACEIMTLLERINQKYGTTMLIVTHNTAICAMAGKTIRMRDGRFVEDTHNAHRVAAVDILWEN